MRQSSSFRVRDALKTQIRFGPITATAVRYLPAFRADLKKTAERKWSERFGGEKEISMKTVWKQVGAWCVSVIILVRPYRFWTYCFLRVSRRAHKKYTVQYNTVDGCPVCTVHSNPTCVSQLFVSPCRVFRPTFIVVAPDRELVRWGVERVRGGNNKIITIISRARRWPRKLRRIGPPASPPQPRVPFALLTCKEPFSYAPRGSPSRKPNRMEYAVIFPTNARNFCSRFFFYFHAKRIAYRVLQKYSRSASCDNVVERSLCERRGFFSLLRVWYFVGRRDLFGGDRGLLYFLKFNTVVVVGQEYEKTQYSIYEIINNDLTSIISFYYLLWHTAVVIHRRRMRERKSLFDSLLCQIIRRKPGNGATMKNPEFHPLPSSSLGENLLIKDSFIIKRRIRRCKSREIII